MSSELLGATARPSWLALLDIQPTQVADMVAILWMDEILHHPRNPGRMITLRRPTNKWLRDFQDRSLWPFVTVFGAVSDACQPFAADALLIMKQVLESRLSLRPGQSDVLVRAPACGDCQAFAQVRTCNRRDRSECLALTVMPYAAGSRSFSWKP